MLQHDCLNGNWSPLIFLNFVYVAPTPCSRQYSHNIDINDHDGCADTSSGDSDIISGSSDESNTESDHAEASRESSTDEEIVLRSKKQKEKMRKKRRHKEMMFKERLRAKIVKKENERKEAKLKVSFTGDIYNNFTHTWSGAAWGWAWAVWARWW